MSLAAIPPLRVTTAYDLQTPIAAWLDDIDDAASAAAATAAATAVYNSSMLGGTTTAGTNSLRSSSPKRPHFRSREVMHDLAKLQRLRSTIVDVLLVSSRAGGKYDEAAAELDTFYEYHASLLQCEQHGICVEEVSSPLEIPWALSDFGSNGNNAHANSRHNNQEGDSDDDRAMNLGQNSSTDRYRTNTGTSSNDMEVHGSITWERINILWNIVALEAYLASNQRLTTRQEWMKAAVHLEKGAGLLRYLRNNVLGLTSNNSHSSNGTPSNPHQSPYHQEQQQQQQQRPQLSSGAYSSSGSPTNSPDFSNVFLHPWEALLTAQAQRSSFEAFRCAARPRHFMLAKLAAAAAPLYGECDQACQTSAAFTRQGGGGGSSSSSNEYHVFLSRWELYARLWGIWMRAKAEHHQAGVHRDKRQLCMELARLNKALALGSKCQELCSAGSQRYENNMKELEGFALEVQQTVDEMQARRADATQEQAIADDDLGGNNTHAAVSPEDLPEIAPQLQVKVNQPLEKILPPLETPLFEDIMNPMVRRYVDLFMTEMDKLLFQMTSIAEEKTESARKALATVNLPHSLTAYRQEQAGGGIPEDLWLRVEAVQQEKRVPRIKQELWELRDIADSARHTYKVIKHQLEEDLAMDELFREQHPNFQGHDAAEVQKTFRQSLENYDRLLVTAQDGDAVLLRRLEMLDTDPKYKLLQFQKSQLDRLLPGAGMVGPAIDTSLLSKLLVELSVLFREREMILNTMREELKNFDIHSRLCEVDLSNVASVASLPSGAGEVKELSQGQSQGQKPEVEREFRRILIESKESFNEIAYDIQENINKQTELVQTILVQNQKFMDARDAMQSSSSSDSCIVMIEDAIEEIEQLSKHLKEGKDFYDVVIPKLDKLKLQVGDVSARLTVERCEYEDNCRRNEQEAEDARMAATFAGNSSEGSGGNDDGDGVGSSSNAPMGEAGGSNRAGADVAPRAQAQPGVEQVSHSQPQVRVDDESVATLVAMDFDPEKVVAALRKYDNNVEQALNELLSG